MSTFTVTTECGMHRDFESRRDAEEGRKTHEALCEECTEGDVRIALNPDRPDGRAPRAEGDGVPAMGLGEAPAEGSLPPELPGSMRMDPLDVVPEYMIDEVDGRPTINKRGYAVIANRFDIVVQAEAITTAGETDHEYAEFEARAWKAGDGPEHGYTGHATARASEARSGIEDNLNEMVETRAMKRAVAWASGVDILAWEELAGCPDDGQASASTRSIEQDGD